MRFSRYFVPTLKEAPAEAEVVSHKLLIRAGMVRRLTSGIYSYLPLGLRGICKVAAIVREEMNRAGASEVLLPAVQPADLWQESGRWEHYGKELLRFKDRHDRDCCFGPTHEEVVTDIIRGEIKSYRQLPLNLYQIQTKFRDEIRPRFGLMRGREFIMKDAYSFDRDDEGADKSYRAMFDAYCRIFSRLGLKYCSVEADSGSIGGSFSHEFMVLAQTGEDLIISCAACSYAANVERAELVPPRAEDIDATEPGEIEEVFTPSQQTVEEVAAFLSIQPSDIVKTILVYVDDSPVAVLVRGDHEMNEVKVKHFLNGQVLRFANPDEVKKLSGAPCGFAGPVKLKVGNIIADNALKARQGWVTGANKEDLHLKNVSLLRDAKITEWGDLRRMEKGEPCPRCGAPVDARRGIEVGHVFKLGTKYSEALKANYVDESGEDRPIIMGCYGIGVSRVLAACIEQNNDEDGIIFPPPVAPFEVMLLNLDVKNEEVSAKADEIYEYLAAKGIDVLLDDREERPGVKFKDADLLGSPMQLVLGRKGLERGIVEAKDRRSGMKVELSLDAWDKEFADWHAQVLEGWKNS